MIDMSNLISMNYLEECGAAINVIERVANKDNRAHLMRKCCPEKTW
jgi:hypothetical protein